MEAKGAPVFFEMHLKFAANGNDFYVVIANFGIGDKTLATFRRKIECFQYCGRCRAQDKTPPD
jgi:hypothetical protein